MRAAEVTIEVGGEFLRSMKENVRNKRSASEIVLVVPRPGGSVLLHTKAFYPEGGYRLPSGRLHNNEDADSAVAREFREELGADGEIVRKLGVLVHHLKAGDESLDFISHVYLTGELANEPQPEDDSEQITGFMDVPMSELPMVARRLRGLPDGWRDWGYWRAAAHEFAAGEI